MQESGSQRYLDIFGFLGLPFLGRLLLAAGLRLGTTVIITVRFGFLIAGL